MSGTVWAAAALTAVMVFVAVTALGVASSRRRTALILPVVAAARLRCWRRPDGATFTQAVVSAERPRPAPCSAVLRPGLAGGQPSVVLLRVADAPVARAASPVTA